MALIESRAGLERMNELAGEAVAKMLEAMGAIGEAQVIGGSVIADFPPLQPVMTGLAQAVREAETATYTIVNDVQEAIDAYLQRLGGG
jgi:hypothetical protein